MISMPCIIADIYQTLFPMCRKKQILTPIIYGSESCLTSNKSKQSIGKPLLHQIQITEQQALQHMNILGLFCCMFLLAF